MLINGAYALKAVLGDRIDIYCTHCGISEERQKADLVAEFGDVNIPNLQTLLSRSRGCARAGNINYDQCRLKFGWLHFVDENPEPPPPRMIGTLGQSVGLKAICACGLEKHLDRWKLQRLCGKKALLPAVADRLRCPGCKARGGIKIEEVRAER